AAVHLGARRDPLRHGPRPGRPSRLGRLGDPAARLRVLPAEGRRARRPAAGGGDPRRARLPGPAGPQDPRPLRRLPRQPAHGGARADRGPRRRRLAAPRRGPRQRAVRPQGLPRRHLPARPRLPAAGHRPRRRPALRGARGARHPPGPARRDRDPHAGAVLPARPRLPAHGPASRAAPVSATALLVGGTGPTGPHLARGLLERGYDVTVFHSGRHETDELPDVEHFHGDPFSADGIAAALGDRRYDVAVATYGRVRLLAEALAGRCDQLLTVGGVPVYRGFLPPEAAQPAGMPRLARETAERVPAEDPPGAIYGVGAVRRTEDAVFALHEAGAFAATIFRYPMLYGPRNPHAWEWSTVWRVLDGRTWMALPD